MSANNAVLAYVYARDNLAAKAWHGQLTTAKAKAIATAIAVLLNAGD